MVVSVPAVLFLAVCASGQQLNRSHYIHRRVNEHFLWRKPGLHFERDVELRSGQYPPSRYAYRRHRWAEGSVPYVIDTHRLSPSQQNTIHQAMQTISSKTNNCIKFHPRSDETAYISYQRGTGCHPAVGYLHTRLRVIVGDGCSRIRTVMHETLRALGFWHEPSRPDRDVSIEWDNIQKEGPCHE